MQEKKDRVSSEAVAQATKEALKRRGVKMEDIAEIVYQLQSPYNPGLSMEDCVDSIKRVLRKREVQHSILVGIELDELAEKKLLSEPLQSIIASDEGLFGVDETLALGAVMTYGSIALTTFGYLDKSKTGIIKELDTKLDSSVHTFLDDLVASIAASAASRIAHRLRDLEEEEDAMADISALVLESSSSSNSGL